MIITKMKCMGIYEYLTYIFFKTPLAFLVLCGICIVYEISFFHCWQDRTPPPPCKLQSHLAYQWCLFVCYRCYLFSSTLPISLFLFDCSRCFFLLWQFRHELEEYDSRVHHASSNPRFPFLRRLSLAPLISPGSRFRSWPTSLLGDPCRPNRR